jgi:glycerophosphoryl diester phosphodiesterase
MLLIAHRGNVNGKNASLENSPQYVRAALDAGFDVEVDVWLTAGKFKLGHDASEYEVDGNFLRQEGLWCHAKHFAALDAMLTMGIHCFYHQQDDYTITSKGYIWTYPDRGLPVSKNSVLVLSSSQIPSYAIGEYIAGVCGDTVGEYRL